MTKILKQFASVIMTVVVLAASDIVRASPVGRSSLHVRIAQKKTVVGSRNRKLEKVRRELHRNLDGKGDGFIVGWEFNSTTFTLRIDERRYEQNMVYAATITARSIFDMNNVTLPAKLVIRGRADQVLGSGPFANVPKIVD